MIKVTLRRSELKHNDACADGRRVFRALAPSGIWQGEWTMLHALWLATVYPDYSQWLINKGPPGWRVRSTCGGDCCGALEREKAEGAK